LGLYSIVIFKYAEHQKGRSLQIHYAQS